MSAEAPGVGEVTDSVFAAERPAVCAALDGFIVKFNEVLAPLWGVLIGVILFNVVARYAFSMGMVSLEELQWHIYSAGFLFGLSYAVVTDDHVRVDVAQQLLPRRARIVIEIFGLMFCLIPIATVIFWYSLPFVANAWILGETSNSPGGLPSRWIVKGFITIGSLMLVLAALSRLIRCFVAFRQLGTRRA
ncbi:TRAP transporter small permease subunit [Acuticoccus mangrovi]|uniref:TRAP transporter small permease protein n=1 Tax=Acuticoccus mangrovi TaxID=2796142 RepID=A0A934MIM5_9HYPH|nr:TRAP transporter small permease subunit [Acuticoccus mangrovi]MBJ3777341.1 TRAP transporter small permease subunit [Acuticoccus mangrovi]